MVTAPGSRLQKQKIQIYPRSAQTQIFVFKGETELTVNSSFVSYTRILQHVFSHININIKQPLKSCVEELILTWSYKPITKAFK